jgi:hypothetical protein
MKVPSRVKISPALHSESTSEDSPDSDSRSSNNAVVEPFSSGDFLLAALSLSSYGYLCMLSSSENDSSIVEWYCKGSTLFTFAANVYNIHCK